MIVTSSCGGGGGGSSSAGANAPPPSTAPIVVTRAVAQSDFEIAQAIYTGTPRTPEGFYEDFEPSGTEYVATAHLKNGDIVATASDPLHELCTDDWNQALEWSETHAQSSPDYADLVATNDDPRYFEFGRVRAGEPELYVRDRVFKCAYVDRAATNLRVAEGAAGQLNMRPLTAAELRTFSEYLWQFTSYNNFGYAVLKSSGESSTATLTHTLHMASLVRNGISATCDRIDVLAWRHTLDAATGELTLDVEAEFSFGARENGGVVELCGG
jgi:hypothetical protein